VFIEYKVVGCSLLPIAQVVEVCAYKRPDGFVLIRLGRRHERDEARVHGWLVKNDIWLPKYADQIKSKAASVRIADIEVLGSTVLLDLIHVDFMLDLFLGARGLLSLLVMHERHLAV